MEYKSKEEKDQNPQEGARRELLGYACSSLFSVVTLSISTPALLGLHINYCSEFQVYPQFPPRSKRQRVIALIFSMTAPSDGFQTNTVTWKW